MQFCSSKHELPKVTIAVGTYNPKPDELLATLYSVVAQEGIDLEVIIADDGSESFDSSLVVGWMEYLGFENYSILEFPVNRGTTVNVLDSVRKANSDFFKGISPGDMLYSSTCIYEAISFLKEIHCDVCFGNAVYYSEDDHDKVIRMSNPSCLAPYARRDRKRIARDYVRYKQYALGAAFVCRTSLLEHYLSILEGRIKYCEDYAYALMVVDDIEIAHWDNYLLWYQYGSGISTSKNQVWTERMHADALAADAIAHEMKPDVIWGIERSDYPERAKRKLFDVRNKTFWKLGIWKKAEANNMLFAQSNKQARAFLENRTIICK